MVYKLANNEVNLVFINSKREAQVNDKIENVINLVKNKGLAVRFQRRYLISNILLYIINSIHVN